MVIHVFLIFFSLCLIHEYIYILRKWEGNFFFLSFFMISEHKKIISVVL